MDRAIDLVWTYHGHIAAVAFAVAVTVSIGTRHVDPFGPARRLVAAIPMWCGAMTAVVLETIGAAMWAGFSAMAVVLGVGASFLDMGTDTGATAGRSDLERSDETPQWDPDAGLTMIVASAIVLAGWWWVVPDNELVVALIGAFVGVSVVWGRPTTRVAFGSAGHVAAASLVAATPCVLLGSSAMIANSVAAGTVALGALPAVCVLGDGGRRARIVVLQLVAAGVARAVRVGPVGPWLGVALAIVVIVANSAFVVSRFVPGAPGLGLMRARHEERPPPRR